MRVPLVVACLVLGYLRLALCAPVLRCGPADFSRNGRHVYVGTLDGQVIDWTFASSRIGGWKAHAGPVTALVVCGNELATAGRDGVVCLWSAPQGHLLGRLGGAAAPIAFPSNSRLVTAAVGGKGVIAWSNGKRQQTFRTADPVVAISPDGQFVATRTKSGRVRIYRLDPSRLRPLLTLSADSPGQPIGYVAFTPDSRRVAVSWSIVYPTHYSGSGADPDGVYFLYDVASGRRVGEGGCGRAVTALAWSADERVVAVGASTGAIGPGADQDGGALRVHGATIDWAVSFAPDLALAPHALAFSSDGARLLTVGTTARVWDAKAGSLLATLKLP
jgi:WD40 repeat protein